VHEEVVAEPGDDQKGGSAFSGDPKDYELWVVVRSA
jgi:hypothetical protein